MNNKLLLTLFVVLVAISATTSYFLFSNISTKPHKPVDEIKEINVRLKWLHQSQFAGHYIADQKGFYEEKGLKVNLYPFDYKNYPIEQVVSGEMDFGVTGADELIIARSEGKKVKAIAVIYQENPVVAYSLSSSEISKPVDFIDKKVGIEAGINVETVIKAMLFAQNIRLDDVEFIPIGFEIDPLIEKEVDVATGYVTNEPVQAEGLGYEVNIIAPHEYGVHIYADVIFTTEKMIEENPEVVRAFVQATLRGWEYALSNQEEAIKATLKYEDKNNENLNFEHQKILLERSAPYIKPDPSISIGEMEYIRWTKSLELLEKYGLVEQGSQDVSDIYVQDFLGF